MSDNRYPEEILAGKEANYGDEEDDGTMPENVDLLRQAVIGRRIISAQRGMVKGQYSWRDDTEGLIITLDDGTQVKLANTSDCCAFTELREFLLHPELVDHMILGVGTTGKYTKWHIYADLGDVLELTVGWSCGNPFYYGYGFDIVVEPIDESA